MKITAGIRVKNGELWAEECLTTLSECVDEIAILDDGSTDATPDICRSCVKVTRFLRWEKSFFHEGMDRNIVLAMVKDTEPDWILSWDIDEVFEEGAAKVLPELVAQDEYSIWGFRMLHFWRDKRHYRVDGRWGEETRNHIHPRLFRNQLGLHFPLQTIHGAHVLGVEGKAAVSDLYIKHYGHSYWDRNVEKYDLYRRQDPGGNYEHLIDETGLQLVDYQAIVAGADRGATA